MTEDRWRELMRNDSLQLTEEEIKEGWHFCPVWDGLLIYRHDLEAQFCICGDSDETPVHHD
jgi:hypothetical protein